MSKHTPGPWVIIPPDAGDLRPKWYVEQPVGYMQPNNKHVSGHCVADVFETDEGEGKANASLIAAAPDLLAALEGLIEAIGPQSASLLSAPYAAINKARSG